MIQFDTVKHDHQTLSFIELLHKNQLAKIVKTPDQRQDFEKRDVKSNGRDKKTAKMTADTVDLDQGITNCRSRFTGRTWAVLASNRKGAGKHLKSFIFLQWLLVNRQFADSLICKIEGHPSHNDVLS